MHACCQKRDRCNLGSSNHHLLLVLASPLQLLLLLAAAYHTGGMQVCSQTLDLRSSDMSNRQHELLLLLLLEWQRLERNPRQKLWLWVLQKMPTNVFRTCGTSSGWRKQCRRNLNMSSRSTWTTIHLLLGLEQQQRQQRWKQQV